MSGATAIEVSHLSKVFGGRSAVDDVSFSVGKGEVFGFLGPNGAGKTTTVRMLGTLIAPTSGSASVAGLPLGPTSDAGIRQRISISCCIRQSIPRPMHACSPPVCRPVPAPRKARSCSVLTRRKR